MCNRSTSADGGVFIDSGKVVGVMLIAIVLLGLLAYCLITPGCAGASSEITPAESAAAEKSVSFTGQSSKRSTLEITIGPPASPAAVGDESEAK